MIEQPLGRIWNSCELISFFDEKIVSMLGMGRQFKCFWLPNVFQHTSLFRMTCLKTGIFETTLE